MWEAITNAIRRLFALSRRSRSNARVRRHVLLLSVFLPKFTLHLSLLAITAATLLPAFGDETNVVFRSDVSLVRVDVQVLDRENRAITGLQAEDFVLRDEGRVQQIRNFSSENMPLDVLFLFDVSASMRPHVERIASAAHDAFRVLGDNDRVAIMVFDRAMRVRMPFRTGKLEVERELERMLRDESFHGGTDITRALIAAANYVEMHGRREARRAIVILTDDQTEFERDEPAVSHALQRADAVLSALIAPDAMGNRTYQGGGRGGSYPGGYPGGGGGWPGSSGPLGGVIWGRRGGYGGRRPGPMGGGGGGRGTRSAGTSEIARQSGGDSLPVDDAYALETTLARIRQRYALHFLVPADARSGQERRIEVALADTARRRYSDADLRFRRTYFAPSGLPAPSNVSAAAAATENPPAAEAADPVVVTPTPNPGLKRRPAISEPDGPRGPNPSVGDTTSGTPARPAQTNPAQTNPAQANPPQNPAATDQQPKSGGWRRLKPGEIPD